MQPNMPKAPQVMPKAAPKAKVVSFVESEEDPQWVTPQIALAITQLFNNKQADPNAVVSISVSKGSAAQPKTQPNGVAEPKAQPQAEPKAQPKALSKAEPEVQSKAESKAEPKAKPAAQPKQPPPPATALPGGKALPTPPQLPQLPEPQEPERIPLPSELPADEEELQHFFLDQAKNAQWANVNEILDMRPDIVNCHPADRWTALHQAVYWQSQDIVRELLARRADPGLPNPRLGYSAAELAAEYGLGSICRVIRLWSVAQQQQQQQQDMLPELHSQLEEGSVGQDHASASSGGGTEELLATEYHVESPWPEVQAVIEHAGGSEFIGSEE